MNTNRASDPSLARRAYRASELTRVLPYGKTKIAEMIKDGTIKSKKFGGSRIVTAEEVERLARGGE